MSSWINHKELADWQIYIQFAPNWLYQPDQDLSPWERKGGKAELRGYMLSCRIHSIQTNGISIQQLNSQRQN